MLYVQPKKSWTSMIQFFFICPTRMNKKRQTSVEKIKKVKTHNKDSKNDVK